jgi:hypothetical protein
MTFARAVHSCPRLKGHYHEGLGALKGNRTRVTTRDTRMILGSLDVEAAQLAMSRGEHTWDYGIGLESGSGEIVIWLEVHPADSLHVEPVLDKLRSLLTFLRNHATALHEFPGRFVWLATKGVAISPMSQERRWLNANGIILRSKKLDLESVI